MDIGYGTRDRAGPLAGPGALKKNKVVGACLLVSENWREPSWLTGTQRTEGNPADWRGLKGLKGTQLTEGDSKDWREPSWLNGTQRTEGNWIWGQGPGRTLGRARVIKKNKLVGHVFGFQRTEGNPTDWRGLKGLKWLSICLRPSKLWSMASNFYSCSWSWVYPIDALRLSFPISRLIEFVVVSISTLTLDRGRRLWVYPTCVAFRFCGSVVRWPKLSVRVFCVFGLDMSLVATIAPLFSGSSATARVHPPDVLEEQLAGMRIYFFICLTTQFGHPQLVEVQSRTFRDLSSIVVVRRQKGTQLTGGDSKDWREPSRLKGSRLSVLASIGHCLFCWTLPLLLDIASSIGHCLFYLTLPLLLDIASFIGHCQFRKGLQKGVNTRGLTKKGEQKGVNKKGLSNRG